MPCPTCCQLITCCPTDFMSLSRYSSINARAAQCESWYILVEQDNSPIISAENDDLLEQELANRV